MSVFSSSEQCTHPYILIFNCTRRRLKPLICRGPGAGAQGLITKQLLNECYIKGVKRSLIDRRPATSWPETSSFVQCRWSIIYKSQLQLTLSCSTAAARTALRMIVHSQNRFLAAVFLPDGRTSERAVYTYHCHYKNPFLLSVKVRRP